MFPRRPRRRAAMRHPRLARAESLLGQSGIKHLRYDRVVHW